LTLVTSAFNFHRLPWAFTTVSVFVIDKVGLNIMQIVNCTSLPSAKFDIKKMLVTWSDDDCMPLMIVQLISTAADGTSLVLHSV